MTLKRTEFNTKQSLIYNNVAYELTMNNHRFIMFVNIL